MKIIHEQIQGSFVTGEPGTLQILDNQLMFPGLPISKPFIIQIIFPEKK
jgi:hypothetical protein